MKLSFILLIQYLIKSANIPCLSDNYFRCIYVFNLRFLVLSFVCELCHYYTFIYTWSKLNAATMAKKCFIILHSFYDWFKSGFFVRFVVLLISCFVFFTITFFDFVFSFTFFVFFRLFLRTLIWVIWDRFIFFRFLLLFRWWYCIIWCS